MHDALTIAGREFGSRLFLGTGKYDTFETMRDVSFVERSGLSSVHDWPPFDVFRISWQP